jgi:hypothetical protein
MPLELKHLNVAGWRLWKTALRVERSHSTAIQKMIRKCYFHNAAASSILKPLAIGRDGAGHSKDGARCE